ncbi:MAG: hypothetical protein WAW96_10070 [Alphaproteobacteria bacterium]
MEPYFFQGVVLPERAQLSSQMAVKFTHFTSGRAATAAVSIVLNQLAVWVDTDDEWDVLDLRNVVKTIVENHLAMVGYIKGYAYDLEITRVVNRARNVDFVFGIDIPCLANRNKDAGIALSKLKPKTIGPNGIYINRCLNDLANAMRRADDTAFYCYRAIESLCNHSSVVHSLESANGEQQWQKFREIAGCEKETLLEIKGAADPLRHGKVVQMTSDDRAALFGKTWDVVDKYLAAV